jgi:hypothetical protein
MSSALVVAALISAGYQIIGSAFLFGWMLIEPICWIAGALIDVGSKSYKMPLTDPAREAEDARLLAAANLQLAFAIDKMTEDDLARLSQYEVNLIADAIHEGSRNLQLAALNALERVGGSEHLHSVNLLILKLRQAAPHLAPQIERDEHAALLNAAEHCAEALRTRAAFQRERDTLLRASLPEEKHALLRPAGSSTADPSILVRPLAHETPADSVTSIAS